MSLTTILENLNFSDKKVFVSLKSYIEYALIKKRLRKCRCPKVLRFLKKRYDILYKTLNFHDNQKFPQST